MLGIAFEVICAAGFLVTVAFLARPDWYLRHRRHIRPDELEFENPRRDSQQVIAVDCRGNRIVDADWVDLSLVLCLALFFRV